MSRCFYCNEPDEVGCTSDCISAAFALAASEAEHAIAEVDSLTARCLAAEQRAEAAEQERDRMRGAARALSSPLTMWAEWAREDENAYVLCGPDAALLTAIDAYRAGQPGPDVAEQIAAWLIREEADDTRRGEFACFLADQIRAGAWRKGQP